MTVCTVPCPKFTPFLRRILSRFNYTTPPTSQAEVPSGLPKARTDVAYAGLLKNRSCPEARWVVTRVGLGLEINGWARAATT